jgi:hypothetical protein
MSDFMRPEARASLWRWREALTGLVLGGIGIWWTLASFGIVRAIGMILVFGAFILVIAGIQQARFRQTGIGPGIVQVAERRLAYFGPLTGGQMDIADLTRLELDPNGLPAAHWVLTGIGGQSIAIPVNAQNADALFDLFGSLEGIQTGVMLDALSQTPDVRVTVWEKTPALLH